MITSKRVAVIVSSVVALAAVLFAAYVWLALTWSYSEGERAGYIQKFSKKGWVCKTWEGELLLTSMPGAIPEKFEFSVRDDAIATQLSASAGKRVVLSYTQHMGLPGSCFGDTEYFVEKVSLMQ
jgi:hypothetical protein